MVSTRGEAACRHRVDPGSIPGGSTGKGVGMAEHEDFRPGGFTVAWIVWILFFVVVEGVALARKRKGDTFSEHWWALFRVRASAPRWLKVTLTVVQLAFGVWLVGHLAFGLWSI